MLITNLRPKFEFIIPQFEFVFFAFISSFALNIIRIIILRSRDYKNGTFYKRFNATSKLWILRFFFSIYWQNFKNFNKNDPSKGLDGFSNIHAIIIISFNNNSKHLPGVSSHRKKSTTTAFVLNAKQIKLNNIRLNSMDAMVFSSIILLHKKPHKFTE